MIIITSAAYKRKCSIGCSPQLMSFAEITSISEHTAIRALMVMDVVTDNSERVVWTERG